MTAQSLTFDDTRIIIFGEAKPPKWIEMNSSGLLRPSSICEFSVGMFLLSKLA
jgi:hypothetical protein